MMTPGWLINRIKLMSFDEVLHRILQAIKQRVEVVLLAHGWQPKPASGCEVAPCYFNVSNLASLSNQKHLDIANSLLNGKINLFDYKNLDVGWPVDWHRDPLTKVFSPSCAYGKSIDYRDDGLVGDIKVLWELGRHQFLVPIAIEYLQKKEDKQLNVIRGVLNSWLEQTSYGYGVHWCSSLEVAIRGMSWAICHQFLLAAGLDKGLFSLSIDKILLERQIYQHAYFIRGHLSLFSSANNHLVGELTGLHLISATFSFQRSEKWRKFAWANIQLEAKKQVYEDGVNKEQASYYHCWVLEYLLVNYLIASHSAQPASDEYVKRLGRMAQFISDTAPLGGMPPQIGDADDGVAILFNNSGSVGFHRDLIGAINLLSQDLVIANNDFGKAFWYSRMLKSGTSARPASVGLTQYPVCYPLGGYAMLGSSTFHTVFDCGPLGYPSIAAHGHADCLNICLAIDKQWWLVDPGTYAYHSERRWRDYFRGSRAHNVLTVNQQDQSASGGPFMWVQQAKSKMGSLETHDHFQSISGQHNGYLSIGAQRVSRSLSLDNAEEILVIEDCVDCDDRIDICINYHFAPEIKVFEKNDNVWTLCRDDQRVKLVVEFPKNLTVKSYRGDEVGSLGWFSSCLGKKIPCLTISSGSTIRKNMKFVTKISVVRD